MSAFHPFQTLVQTSCRIQVERPQWVENGLSDLILDGLEADIRLLQ